MGMYDYVKVGDRLGQVKCWSCVLDTIQPGARVDKPGAHYSVKMEEGGFLNIADGVLQSWTDHPQDAWIIDKWGDRVWLTDQGEPGMTTDVYQLVETVRDGLEHARERAWEFSCARVAGLGDCDCGVAEARTALDTLVSRLREAEAQLERQEAALRALAASLSGPITDGQRIGLEAIARHALSTPPNQDASSVTPAAADGSATKERLEPEVSPRRSGPSNLARDAAGATPPNQEDGI